MRLEMKVKIALVSGNMAWNSVIGMFGYVIAELFLRDGTKTHFDYVTNDWFNSLDVTKCERISEDQLAFVVARVLCLSRP